MLIAYATMHANDLKYFPFSVGIKHEDFELAQAIYDIAGDKAIILVDIAHGHTKNMGHFVSRIKKIGFHTVVAGNIATSDGYKFLEEHGADAVRVGVAGGKMCTTKYVTGTHVPTIQSVIDCAEVKGHASIIADGGIASSGDAAKALAGGADFVSTGTLWAATSDSPSELFEENGIKYKLHYGMSSKTAIDQFFGDKKPHVAPEGKTEKILYTGETSIILAEFLAGIKSSLTYSGCKNIKDFQKNAILCFKDV